VLFDKDSSILRSLILAIGSYAPEALASNEHEQVSAALDRLYRDDPDAGIHGAAEWTLRRWRQKEKTPSIELERISFDKRGERRWYTTGLGHTFVVIDGPVELRTGSPPTDDERSAATETVRQMSIPRSFAVSAREVTVAQFERFVKETGLHKLDGGSLRRYSPGPDGPCLTVSWFAAAAYCNWLSKQEGLAASQWCYEPNADGVFGDGMKIPADALERTGYRLPTEAEWEYASRAGTETSRYYGSSIELLPNYAWCQSNSDGRSSPAGSLLPNDLGLFDTLGSVYEWCQDRNGAYRFAEKGIFTDVLIEEVVRSDQYRIFRGGAFAAAAAEARSASRGAEIPTYDGFILGFRVARTLPKAP
jgi:formylglycine-generating enzyme required for sulfatase activity